MLAVDGNKYEPQKLPTILFGSRQPLAYVLNPKAACTLALHFLFFVNHNYRYFDLAHIHFSRLALFRIKGPEVDPRVLDAYYRLSPRLFSIVRDPLRRFVSAFYQKVFTAGDPDYLNFRDMLTSVHGINLSPEAEPAQTCLEFAKWVAAHKDQQLIEPHFRPQYLNLASNSRIGLDMILRLEDRERLLTFFSEWIGEKTAKWFLSLQFNVQSYAHEKFITDEVKGLVRHIYREDYKLFYDDR